MKLKIIIIAFLICFSNFSYSLNFISSSLLSEIESFISNEYYISDSNLIHSEVNDSIQQQFFNLYNSYEIRTQSELDAKAITFFKILYDEVHFGFLEDNLDLRRQSQRAAFCYSAIALCSNYDYTYYLKLANDALFIKDDTNYELLNESYAIQILLNIYISYKKSSLSGIRTSIQNFTDNYSHSSYQSEKIEKVKKLIEKVSAGLPSYNK